MNLFALIFWACIIVDVLVPGVSVHLGWYVFWAALAFITADHR